MDIHLDTNYLIRFANGSDSEITGQVFSWIKARERIYASAVAWAEFQCGPLTFREHETAHEILHGVLPVTLDHANQAGWLFQKTGRRSRSLADCLIAACAMQHGAFLATDNRSDFETFVEHGLKLAPL